MGWRDTDGADYNENYLSDKTFLKKQIGKYDETDARNEKKQSSDFAVLLEIWRQKTQRSDRDGETDKNILDAFVRQNWNAEQRKKRNDKRHRQTMRGAEPRNRRACFV